MEQTREEEGRRAEIKALRWICKKYCPGAAEQLDAEPLNFEPWLSEAGILAEGDDAVWGRMVRPPHSTPANTPATISEHDGNALIGFLPYKGPTEKARMAFAFAAEPWLDCRVWSAWESFKKKHAGTRILPTGCLPMVCDDQLKTPSGDRHRMSEWVAVEYYVGAKYGLIGNTAREVVEILLLRHYDKGFRPKHLEGEMCDNSFEGIATELRWPFLEAALQVSEEDFFLKSTVTFADLVLFNSLSNTYGSQTFRDAFGPLFELCFPRLTKFYKTMLTKFPHLREYIFSDAHTPAPYFMPWQQQTVRVYRYSQEDKNGLAYVPSTPASVSSEYSETYNELKKKVAENLGNFPLLRDDDTTAEFDTFYVSAPEALTPDDSPPWQLFVRVCKDMGVANIRHVGCCDGVAPDGPVLNWSPTKHEIFIPIVYIAARKDLFPLGAAADGAKVLQVLSTVRQLCGTWRKDPASFKNECFDKQKCGDRYTNVSPGNFQFLEVLLSMNEWKEGGFVVGTRQTVADLYIFRFLQLVDECLLEDDEEGNLLSRSTFAGEFPLINAFYESIKMKQQDEGK